MSRRFSLSLNVYGKSMSRFLHMSHSVVSFFTKTSTVEARQAKINAHRLVLDRFDCEVCTGRKKDLKQTDLVVKTLSTLFTVNRLRESRWLETRQFVNMGAAGHRQWQRTELRIFI
jgi:hypothetical protein